MTVTVSRRIELNLPVDELRMLVTTVEGWRDWLVDDASIVIERGATGWVTTEGERRTIEVLVRDDDGVVLEWADDEGLRSTVSIRVDLDGEVPAVEIEETSARADASIGWDVRIAVLWIRATLGSPAVVGR